MKKKLKIGQYLMKLCLKYYWFVFSGHSVYTTFIHRVYGRQNTNISTVTTKHKTYLTAHQ